MSSSDAPPRMGRMRLSVGAAVVVGLVVLSIVVGVGLLRGQSAPVQQVPVAPTPAASEGAAVSGELYVHVLGAVAAPGLYVLDADARVVDALSAAGGTTDEADLAAVNLARRLADGEQVVVPVIGAAPPPPGSSGDAGGDVGGLIDLNTADEAALDTLPRIGPALAQRIIAWREENGRFQSVDDLLAVSGIGEKLLAGIRDSVRV